MPKFKKIPVVIEAILWDGKNETHTKIITSFGANRTERGEDEVLRIETLEGIMRAQKGDWIIKGVKGEIYPCKPDIFAQTYEAVECEYHEDGRHRYVPCDDHPATCWCGDQSGV